MLTLSPRLIQTTALVAASFMPIMATPPAFAQSAAPQAQAIEVNGRPLDDRGRQVLRQLEATIGQVPAGRYWYDAVAGGAGVWGGPTTAYLGPGLALGGRLPAGASGGGNGNITGVFINGRELHRLDVAGLSQFGQVLPGRYTWDGFGNVSIEGGPPLFNFFAVVAQQRASSGGSIYRKGEKGDSTHVSKGCTAVHGRLSPSDTNSTFSYYAGC